MGTKKDSTFVAEKITLGMPKNIVEPMYSDEEMKLRDVVAIEVMKDQLSYRRENDVIEDIASWSYILADAMMKVRKRGLQ
jgi:hypothetical protein